MQLTAYPIVNVTVVIPTFRRTNDLRQTLGLLQKFEPLPAEVIVHVDANDTETAPMLVNEFPSVILIQSESRQGPGGGRNRLIRQAKHECVVSLDDDSWPLDTAFFQHAHDLVSNNDKVGVFACHIVEASDREANDVPLPINGEIKQIETKSTGCFVGCGSIYRQSAFLETAGYLPLQEAYGMEEIDVSLQLLDLGWDICQVDQLSVYHNCDRQSHHANPRINAAQIRNTALLAFLRYPLSSLPKAVGQVLNRILFSMRRRRLRGILIGTATIPIACWRYRGYRSLVSVATLRHFWKLR